VANPIAEAFVRIRPDVVSFPADLQRSVAGSLGNAGIPTGGLILGGGFKEQTQKQIKEVVEEGAENTPLSDQAGRTLAQKLFGPGFRNETGRALQGALSGVGQGQLAAQFAFFGPGGATLAVVGGALAAATVSAATFERSLDVLRVTSGATEAQLAEMADEAKKLGADITLPAVTAQTAADAMGELAKAGLSVQDSLSGARGVLELATAAEISAASAAQIVAGALNSFQLRGTEAVHVADLLAGASISAQGDIGDMSLALQQSSAVADQAGLSIDQLVGLITELARQGILGSDAGTSIRTMLLRLTPTTKEASQITHALGIELDRNRTIGEQLPEILDQYQKALSKLDPITRQQALTQIFGTDAIRSATVAFQGGAKGLDAATKAADRQGAAQELATARTQGTLGKLQGLQSTVQTLGLDIGKFLLPPLGQLADDLTVVAGISIKAVDALEKIAGVKIPGTGLKITSVLKEVALFSNPVGQSLEMVRGAKAIIEGFGSSEFEAAIALGKTSQAFKDQNSVLFQHVQFLKNLVAQLGRVPTEKEVSIILKAKDVDAGIRAVIDAAAKAGTLGGDAAKNVLERAQSNLRSGGNEMGRILTGDFKDVGKGLGIATGDGIAQGITESGQRSIDAAKKNLADVRAAGDEQITAAILSARGNLESLGSTLTEELDKVLDASPIAQKIKEIDDELQKLQDTTSKRKLRFDVTTAKQDLEDAKASIVSFGKLTPEQKKDQDEFLKPFKQKVDDAKASLKEFDLTKHRDDLQKTLDQDKKTAEQGVLKLVDAFERGKLSAEGMSKALTGELAPAFNILDTKAGKNLGLEITRDFKRDVTALVGQAEALAGFLGRPGTTPGPQVVKPSATVLDVQNQIRDATQNVAQTIKDAKEQAKTQTDTTNGLLRRIAKALEGGSGSKK
jgi:TP901 family phage tail tape measure protein